VHVVTSNTGVEQPEMDAYLKLNIQNVNKAAQEQGLPIYGYLAQPEIKSRFFYQVLGKGNTPVNAKSKFRWCTDRLKQKPVDEIIQQIMTDSAFSFGDKYDVCLLLGVRDSESIKT
jgi:DNA sulfur modification protein DndC